MKRKIVLNARTSHSYCLIPHPQFWVVLLLAAAIAVAPSAGTPLERTPNKKGRCLDSCRVYHQIISCASFHVKDIMDCHSSFPDARVLDLSYCKIPKLRPKFLAKLPLIERLYLDGASIGRVDCKLSHGLNNLRLISVRGLGAEGLREILPSVLKAPALKDVNLDGNFRNCTCLTWLLYKKLDNRKVRIVDLNRLPECPRQKTDVCSPEDLIKYGELHRANNTEPPDKKKKKKSRRRQPPTPWYKTIEGIAVIVLLGFFGSMLVYLSISELLGNRRKDNPEEIKLKRRQSTKELLRSLTRLSSRRRTDTDVPKKVSFEQVNGEENEEEPGMTASEAIIRRNTLSYNSDSEEEINNY